METRYVGNAVAPPSSSEKCQGQVPTQLDRLNDAISSLRGLIGALEDRLSSVLSGGAAQDGKAVPAPVLVPLAEGIRAAVDDVRALQLRCEALLNAIQL